MFLQGPLQVSILTDPDDVTANKGKPLIYPGLPERVTVALLDALEVFKNVVIKYCVMVLTGDSDVAMVAEDWAGSLTLPRVTVTRTLLIFCSNVSKRYVTFSTTLEQILEVWFRTGSAVLSSSKAHRHGDVPRADFPVVSAVQKYCTSRSARSGCSF